jgi:hypothetical protein
MTSTELHDHLLTLRAESAAASLEGLDANAAYVEDLRNEMEATRYALFGAAVTEIASLRAQLSGALQG